MDSKVAQEVDQHCLPVDSHAPFRLMFVDGPSHARGSRHKRRKIPFRFCSWFLKSSAARSSQKMAANRYLPHIERCTTANKTPDPRLTISPSFHFAVRCINRTFVKQLPAPASWVDDESVRPTISLARNRQGSCVDGDRRPRIGFEDGSTGWPESPDSILSPCVPPSRVALDL
ncbi:uncharacterized protein BJX67DRAFT_45638 [Aspergillus lucknowensis]|uniref:Uncharacterized protein n=1 Tax=Aspergillus lucknowensis TaxID=176173 RepID=A0ABR4LZ56_9EURO